MMRVPDPSCLHSIPYAGSPVCADCHMDFRDIIDFYRKRHDQILADYKALGDAYLRLRTKIPGAFKTPYGPTDMQVWETTEQALDRLVASATTPAAPQYMSTEYATTISLSPAFLDEVAYVVKPPRWKFWRRPRRVTWQEVAVRGTWQAVADRRAEK